MAGISSETSNKMLKSEALYKCVMDTSVLPREPDCLRDLRLVTDKHKRFFMQSSPDKVLLLQMLIKLAGARRTLEVGVFTGYSLLATALALPDDGKVIAVDVSREYYNRSPLHRVRRRRGQGRLPLGPRAGAPGGRAARRRD